MQSKQLIAFFPERRRFIAVLFSSVLTVTLVGCNKGSEPNEPISTEPTASETSEPISTETVSVSEPTIQKTPVNNTTEAVAAPQTVSVPDNSDASVTATAPLADDAGQQLYDKQCKVCHDSGLLDAPKIGDNMAWAPRIQKGIDTLSLHSAKGFNKMPPQAINGVTDAQVHAAVEYMVSKSS